MANEKNIRIGDVLLQAGYINQNELDEALEYQKNNKGIPIAFMGTKDQKIEMLFVNDKERNKELGKQLVSYGIINYNIKEVTVNEQDNDAKGFYEHIGFKVYKKEELDEQGNHYPILYMKLTTK